MRHGMLIITKNEKFHLRVFSGLFGNTSTLVNFLTGVRVNLFFALHSYCPESLTNADLIINSDRRLEKRMEKSRRKKTWWKNWKKKRDFDSLVPHIKLRFHGELGHYLKCTNWYLFRFFGMDRLSLNHVTFGGGWPRTLHTILSRLPSLIVALFAVSDSIEARCPTIVK